MTHDPVCFAEVDELGAREQKLMSEANGRQFHFCSGTCKERFDRDPGAFMEVHPVFQDDETTDDEPADGRTAI